VEINTPKTILESACLIMSKFPPALIGENLCAMVAPRVVQGMNHEATPAPPSANTNTAMTALAGRLNLLCRSCSVDPPY
jgi:hypothetical protein